MKNNWKKCKLSEYIMFKNGKKRPEENGFIPVFGGNGILSYTNQSNYDNCVIIGRVGAYCGNVFLSNGKCWVSDNAIMAKNNENASLKYIFYLLKSLELNKRQIGSGQPLITQDILNGIEVSVPPLTTQRQIAKILSSLDDKIELNNRINKNLEEQAMAIYEEMIVKLVNNKNGKIGDYCSVKSGFAFKGSWWTDSGVKVIKIKTIDNNTVNFKDCSYVGDDKIQFAEEFIAKEGDVLIAMTGATIGKIALVPKVKEILLVNQRVGKFMLGNNPLDNLPFLYCTLEKDDIINEIIKKGQGSAQPNISPNDIMNTLCYIPNDKVIKNFNKVCKPFFEIITKNRFENEQLTQLRDTLLPKLMNGEIDV